MVQQLRFPAQLVIGQRVGRVVGRSPILISAARIGLSELRAAIEPARAEALRPGVVKKYIVGHMPAQDGTSLEPVIARVVVARDIEVGAVWGAARDADAARLPVPGGRRGAGSVVGGRRE